MEAISFCQGKPCQGDGLQRVVVRFQQSEREKIICSDVDQGDWDKETHEGPLHEVLASQSEISETKCAMIS